MAKLKADGGDVDAEKSLGEIKKAEASVQRCERKVTAAKDALKDAKADLDVAINRLRTLATGQGEFFSADDDTESEG